MRRVPFAVVSVSLLVAAAAAACSMGSPASPSFASPPSPAGDASSSPSRGPTAPFAPDSPYSYVGKVKNVLVGLPPTDDEMKSVAGAADPQGQLGSLIKGWMAVKDPNNAEGMTYYAEKMLVFFKLATQQTQISVPDFLDQTYPNDSITSNGYGSTVLLQQMSESFARTMIAELVDGTQPTTQATTTTSFMMTTALMELYAWLDTWQVDDSGVYHDLFAQANPTLQLRIGSAIVPISDSVNPSSPNFMFWTDPDVAPGGAYSKQSNPAGCATDPIVLRASGAPLFGSALHNVLYGAFGSRIVAGVKCFGFNGTAAGGQLGNPANGGANDFRDWRMVTIRQPAAAESKSAFYDLPSLRQSSTLVLNLPRVGFFTTPAFFANWPTNASNSMRVTINQTMIVALGSMFDGTDTTVPQGGASGMPPGLDVQHATTECIGCHQLLDPTRSVLSSGYSWYYHTQDDAGVVAQKGEFAFQSVIAYPQTVYDLGKTLSSHPLFAQAWVQKLCYYVNSQPCEVNDPEFARIVQDFQTNGFTWNELVAELLSSPLTTNAVATQSTGDEGVTVAVLRRDHLCAALNFRLGFNDVCALLPTSQLGPVASPPIEAIAGGLPSDGYGRGAVAPVLPNSPSLFYRTGTEHICEAVAQLVIDVPSAKQVSKVTWSSTSPTQAITDFAQTLMGLVPSDPRYAQALGLLNAHYEAALMQQGTTPTQALQSTFVAACLAPSALSVGF